MRLLRFTGSCQTPPLAGVSAIVVGMLQSVRHQDLDLPADCPE
jgi:hypothetical protein